MDRAAAPDGRFYLGYTALGQRLRVLARGVPGLAAALRAGKGKARLRSWVLRLERLRGRDELP